MIFPYFHTSVSERSDQGFVFSLKMLIKSSKLAIWGNFGLGLPWINQFSKFSDFGPKGFLAIFLSNFRHIWPLIKYLKQLKWSQLPWYFGRNIPNKAIKSRKISYITPYDETGRLKMSRNWTIKGFLPFLPPRKWPNNENNTNFLNKPLYNTPNDVKNSKTMRNIK